MKSLWNCTLSVAGLSVPVKLYSATRQSNPPFELVDTRSMTNIRMMRLNKNTNEPVPGECLGKAYKFNGALVPVTNDLIKSCIPEKNNILDFTYFVYLFDILPVYFENFYYLLPEQEVVSAPGYYSFLLSKLQEYNIAGITQAVFRNLSHLFALFHFSNTLVLYKLRFDSQFIPFEQPLLPKAATYAATFMDKFDALLSDNTRPFNVLDFKDTFTDNLLTAIRDSAASAVIQ